VGGGETVAAAAVPAPVILKFGESLSFRDVLMSSAALAFFEWIDCFVNFQNGF